MYSDSITLVVVVIGVLTCHLPRLLNTVRTFSVDRFIKILNEIGIQAYHTSKNSVTELFSTSLIATCERENDTK